VADETKIKKQQLNKLVTQYLLNTSVINKEINMTQITRIGIYQRPDVSVEFFPPESQAQETAQYTDYLNTNYIATGLLVSRDIATTDDGLTRTITDVWATQEVYDQYLANPVVENRRVMRSYYNRSNGITETFPN